MSERDVNLIPTRFSYIALIVASILGSLGIMFGSWWFLTPLSLALFFATIESIRSTRTVLLYGFLFGYATGGAGIAWFWNTLPLSWLGLENANYAWWLVFISWAAVTAIFALVTAVWSPLFKKVLQVPYIGALLVAIVFALHEEARMWAFSILTYAPRGLLGPHFSPISFGYPLAENPYLLQLARDGGVAYLNTLVALIGSTLVLLAHRVKEKKYTYATVLSSIVLISILALPLTYTKKEYKGEVINLALVTTNVPINIGPNSNEEYLALLTRLASSTPALDVIILPEEDRMESAFTSEKERKDTLHALFPKRKVLIIGPRHTPAPEGGRNIAVVYENEQGEEVGRYAKRFLMPGGEYMPYMMTGVFSVRNDTGLHSYYKEIPDAPVPPTPLTSILFKGERFGTLICSDILSPVLYRELATKGGASILVNVANASWFHHSSLLEEKTLQIAKVHAVQNQTYFFQAANGTPSFSVAPDGTVFGYTPKKSTGVLYVTLAPNTIGTSTYEGKEGSMR